MKEQIELILKNTLPSEAIFDVRESVFMGAKSLLISIAASNHCINGVSGQYPQHVALMLHYEDMDMHTQHIGGSGGGNIYRKPDTTNPKEKYYAMIGVKIPFRKPQPTEQAVLKAVERFALRWLQTLKDNRNALMYENIVDYDKLLM